MMRARMWWRRQDVNAQAIILIDIALVVGFAACSWWWR